MACNIFFIDKIIEETKTQITEFFIWAHSQEIESDCDYETFRNLPHNSSLYQFLAEYFMHLKINEPRKDNYQKIHE